MTPSRIIFFSHSSELSGAPKCLLEIVGNIERSNYLPIVITPEKGLLIESLKEAKVEVKIVKGVMNLYSKSQSFLFKFFSLLKRVLLNLHLTYQTYHLIRESKADLIYLNSIASRYAGISAKLSGLPVIWHIHESYQSRSKRFFFSLFIRWIADKIIFNSKANRDLWGANKFLRKGILVYNGIDLRKTGELRQKKIEIEIRNVQPLIGYIGQINPFKGVNVLIGAVDKIKPSIQDVTCLIIGKPSPNQEGYYEGLKEQVMQKGLEQNIKFIGFQQNIFPLLDKIDVLVMPSLFETFGRVLVEGMALGKPIVATQVGGVPEIVIDYETGILVPPNDSQKLAEAILSLLENPLLRQRLGEAGQKRAKEFFTLESYCTKIENVIAKLLEHKLRVKEDAQARGTQ